MITSDEQWMQIALQEAKKGLGLVSPNPAVGSVIVYKDTLIAKGYHAENGGPHAEANAIAAAYENASKEILQQSTIYVTLEPCSTQGRTGACTNRIIEAGLKKVIFGTMDPNPAHAGNSIPILEAAGIEVVFDVCKKECDHLIRGFRKVQTTGLPWIAVKVGQSIDGRLDRPVGESQWLTSPASKQKVQELRQEFDATATTSRTILADNPSLTRRDLDDIPLPLKKQNQRFVLSRTPLSIPKNFKVFTDPFSSKTTLIDTVDLEKGFREIAKLGYNSIMVESGGAFTGLLLKMGLIDEWISFLAPIISGGETFTSRSSQLTETHFELTHHEILESDLYTRSVKISEPASSIYSR